MWQTAFNIFQRVLFYTLDSSLIFSPTVNHIAVRKYLRDIFTFLIQKKKKKHFWSFHAFQKKVKAKGDFPNAQSQDIMTHFYLLA